MKQVLIVLALTSLGAAACTSGHASPIRPTNPSSTTGGVPAQAFGSPPSVYECPLDALYAAYGRSVFPPTHPQLPDTSVRPVRCFASLRQAEGAGYGLAPTPAGDLLVDEVYLVPTPSRIVAACRRAATNSPFAVPCPELVPFGWDCDAPCDEGVLTGLFWPTPPGYVGFPEGSHPQPGHLNLWGYPSSARFFCPGGRVTGSTKVMGQRATWEDCPEGSAFDSGHVLLWWRDSSAVYGISLHGHSQVNRDIVLAIAQHVRLVSKR